MKIRGVKYKSKTIFLLLLFQVNLYVLAQTKKVCAEQEGAYIYTTCEACNTKNCNQFYIGFKTSFSDSLKFDSYNIVNFAKNGGKMFLLTQKDSSNRTKQTLLNLKTGKLIVPLGYHTIKYQYNEDGGKLLVSGLYDTYIADTEGNVLYSLGSDIWNASFCQESGWYAYDGKANASYLYNSKGEITATYKDKEIQLQIDSTHFIAKTDKGYYYIVNNKGETVFGDGCATEMELFQMVEKPGETTSAVLTRGLCYNDDDVTMIIQDKKGKWFDPLKDFSKNHYIEYVLPFNINSTDKNDWFCYVVSYDNKQEKDLIALLNYKGEIVLKLNTDKRYKALNLWKESPFIYMNTKSGYETYVVFTEDGTLLLEDDYNQRAYLNENIESKGYYCLINYELDKTHLYHTDTKKLITLQGTDHNFETLDEITNLFK